MAVARLKTWISEILTAGDLNGEFDNILDNQQSLGNPRTSSFDMDGNELILDADGDSSLTSDTDDVVDLRLQGVDLYQWDGDATSPVNGVVFRATATGSDTLILAGTNTGADTNTGIDIQSGGTGSIKVDSDVVLTGGRHTIAVPAGAMKALTTNGAAAAQVEIVAGQPEPDVFDFDGTTEESVQWVIPMPKSWDGGTISFKVHFYVSAAVSTSVSFALAARAFASGDSVNAAYGTAQAVTTAYSGTSNELAISAEPGTAVTVAGSPAGGQLVYFKLFRDTDASENGATADDTSQDARVAAVELYYEVNARNDD